MVGMAFTHSSSDFSFILSDVANKSMLQGWADSPETFDRWTRAGNLPDFKPGHRVGLDTFPRLREVRPGAEYKYATIGEKGEKIILATYGELFSIDRQSIINDDLSVLSTIPMSMGRAAKATVGDLVYAVLQNNPALSDGLPLFGVEHNNYVAGELSVDNLASARAQMRLQKSQAGQVLNIVPKFLIVPAIQEALAETIIRSISVPGSSNSGTHNPVRDTLDIVVEPRLDGVDEDAWYLAAAQGSDTIEVAEILGRDRKSVAAIARPLKPTPDSSKTRKNYTVRTLLQALGNPQDLDVNQMTPAERRAHWQAENERLKYEAARRFLIPAEECAREFRAIARGTIMTLETLPDILERDCALSNQAVTRMVEVIDKFRDHLAVELMSDKFYDDIEEKTDGENE